MQITINAARITDPGCFQSHMGVLWAVEEERFKGAVQAYAEGRLAVIEHPPVVATEGVTVIRSAGGDRLAYHNVDGVAVVPMVGSMDKGFGKYNGVSTKFTQLALDTAAADKRVKSILLRIESPGGAAAGTMELADKVRAVDALKPVYAFGEDLVASAAYWVASAARKISANAPAEIGSVGTFAVIQDLSQRAADEGVKVHVISTGKFKGAGVPGTEVTQEQLDLFQERVNEMNSHFQSAVSAGRGLTGKQLADVSTGRVWSAAKAMQMGLIDAVTTFEASLEEARAAGENKPAEPARARMAMAKARRLRLQG